jgi:hypothetical protein
VGCLDSNSSESTDEGEGGPAQEDTAQPDEGDTDGEKGDAAWYVGGTLHSATLAQWHSANYENRLATCADFVAAACKAEVERDFSILKPRATALESCITTATSGIDGIQDHKVADYAAACLIELGYVVMGEVDGGPEQEDTTQPDEIEPVEILSHSSYVDSSGTFKVVGEVKNIGDDNLNLVRLTATFYDNSHVVVGTDFTFSDIQVLVPGQKSPFEVFLLDDTASASVDHYVVVVSNYNVTTEQPYREFEILSHTSSIASWGAYKVVGEVENIGARSATWLRVDGTFYDATGGVVACDFRFTDPGLDAGQIAPFELTVLNETLAASVASYELQVQGSCG